MSCDEIRALWQRSKFVWGKTDCVMATSNYVLSVTGVDPAAPWRGSYDDEAGAQSIYQEFGGVLGLTRHAMSLAGFKAAPRGVLRPVVCDFGGLHLAGVDLGTRVAFMAERGMVETRAEVVEAWAI
jgi:hypothetical protein